MKDNLEDSVEMLLEKLLHCTQDLVAKVVVPLLASKDEKLQATCTRALIKVLSSEYCHGNRAKFEKIVHFRFICISGESVTVRFMFFWSC